MPHNVATNRKLFSAERVRPPAASTASLNEPVTRRDVENIQNALLAMSKDIKSLAAQRDIGDGNGISQPASLAGFRSVVVEAIAEPMDEIRQTVQQMKDFRDASLPAMSDAIKVTAQAIASQMSDIRLIAQEIKEMEDVSHRGLRKELAEMMAHIDSTKTEIASLRPAGGQDDQIVVATSELDAVVEATEAATSEILEQAEKIQDIVQKLRADGGVDAHEGCAQHLNDLEDVSTQLLMSCGFQDLTGQRINKVVNTLLYLEQHISTMMTIWEIERGTGESKLMVNAPDDNRPDKDLLNGPQLSGAGVSQDDIDALFD